MMSGTIKKFLNQNNAHITTEQYQALYQKSLNDPIAFWTQEALKFLDWQKPWHEICKGDWQQQNIEWFCAGQLNVCYNCLDRHLQNNANQLAIIWEGDDPNDSRIFTYKDLHDKVCQFANALKSFEVKKGDRICIYMPMIPEAVISMLACARIGVIHSVVFAGFSSRSLQKRIDDANCSLIITADGQIRGGKVLPLKANVDEIFDQCISLKKTIVVKYANTSISMTDKDVWFHECIKDKQKSCPVEFMDANDPLFILYTSGSTGRPKGILHGQAGYLLQAAMTFYYLFNYMQGEVYWCTADIGWITGHSYLVYGPLANGATTLMYAGVPNYPDYSRYWQIIDKYQVNIFYTAPTAIRALMREGDNWVLKSNRSSLRQLGTVGEPINPKAWQWFYEVVGNQKCPIVDTWWQTETGAIMISPFPYATALKPGATSVPFFGVELGIVNDSGEQVKTNEHGNLVIKRSWPSQLKTIYGDPERFYKTYFSQLKNHYFAGDSAYIDEDKFYHIMGRTDDVINVSGHRLDTAEIESALVAHPKVVEAAVIGYPHEIKGQGIYAFVTTEASTNIDEMLKQELLENVKTMISPIAKPDHILFTETLPKTRSGKIMRRILKQLVIGKTDDLGDISTLTNPESIDSLKRKI